MGTSGEGGAVSHGYRQPSPTLLELRAMLKQRGYGTEERNRFVVDEIIGRLEARIRQQEHEIARLKARIVTRSEGA